MTEELRQIVLLFRVSELQALLEFAGVRKSGKKTGLQAKALELLEHNCAKINDKILEIHHWRRSNPLKRYKDDISHFNHDPNGCGCSPQGYRPSQNMQEEVSQYSDPYKQVPQRLSLPGQLFLNREVHLKPLPFYDLIEDLIPAASLLPKNNGCIQESIYSFTLTADQAHRINLSRKASSSGEDFSVKLLMRFCLLNTISEQDDCFPSSIRIKANQVLCPLPNIFVKPGCEAIRPGRPLEITKYCKLLAPFHNFLTVSWAAEATRSYVMTVQMVERINAEKLQSRLKLRDHFSAESTLSMVKEKLSEDSEISTTSLKVSLVCPLAKQFMSCPTRCKTCSHLQCFDAYFFLMMNERKPTWICPVCNGPAQYKDLHIDDLFLDICRKIKEGCSEIQFDEDGSWSPVDSSSKQKNGGSKKHLPTKRPRSIENIEKPCKRRRVEFIDLTLEESRDSEPFELSESSSEVNSPATCTTSNPTFEDALATLNDHLPTNREMPVNAS